MSGSSAELRRLFTSYRSRGHVARSVSWSEAHLAGSAVIAETATSAYVFIPVYLGQEHVALPGGGFRMACFTLEASGERPDVLITRPWDVAVGERLWMAIAQDKRSTTGGLTMGEITIDLTRQIPTSPIEALYVVLADPGAPEF